MSEISLRKLGEWWNAFSPNEQKSLETRYKIPSDLVGEWVSLHEIWTKENRRKAIYKWWSTMSLNEWRALEAKYNVAGWQVGNWRIIGEIWEKERS